MRREWSTFLKDFLKFLLYRSSYLFKISKINSRLLHHSVYNPPFMFLMYKNSSVVCAHMHWSRISPLTLLQLLFTMGYLPMVLGFRRLFVAVNLKVHCSQWDTMLTFWLQSEVRDQGWRFENEGYETHCTSWYLFFKILELWSFINSTEFFFFANSLWYLNQR